MSPLPSRKVRMAALAALSALAAAILFFAIQDFFFPPLPAPEPAPDEPSWRNGFSRADASAPGAPIGFTGNSSTAATTGYTNESLRAALDAEKSKMGIRKILEPGQNVPDSGADTAKQASPSERAQRRKEARIWMRELAAEIGLRLESKEPPAVSLKGERPSLLSSPENAQPAAGTPVQNSP